MPESHDGVRFEQVRSGRSSLESSADGDREEAFALLSDSGVSELEDETDEKEYAASRGQNGHPTRGRDVDSVEARAKDHAKTEHALTPLRAVRAYPMAVFWTLMVSFTVIMEGKRAGLAHRSPPGKRRMHLPLTLISKDTTRF